MGFSVVIPSRNPDNLIPCVSAVLDNEPDAASIIVVDDGLDFSEQQRNTVEGWMRSGKVRIVHGVKPFVFARNSNIGIAESGDQDVVLLNDDALLCNADGFTLLQSITQQYEAVGIAAATTNVTGYIAQRKAFNRCTPSRATNIVAFMCVLIPRRTINLVGYLDERFITYGGEDVDYCLRVRAANKRVVVCDGCYVDHRRLKSTFRPDGGGGDIKHGLDLLREKWGFDCHFL